MINKKTTGVPNVDRVTDDIYNHLNKMTSTPSVGTKGERGNTGIQGIQGVTGLVGATGVGFNYQLLAGNGLTGMPYDGTSNVTWSKDTVDTFVDFSKKTTCNWGTTTPGETGNYWIKVATITLDGPYSSGSLYAKIYGNRSDFSFFTQEILVCPTNSATGLSNSNYTSNIRTYQSTPSRSMSVGKTFKDIKLVHISGSGVSNNVIELWAQLSYRLISSCMVEAYTKGTITLLTNRDAAYANLPSSFITILDQNSFSYSENFAIGSSSGESGVSLSVGGKTTLSDTPITSGTPQYVLVKDTGSNIVKTIPYPNKTLTIGKGLTGLNYNGTSSVTIQKDNYDGYFDYLHRIIANWGTSGNPSLTTNKWVKIAEITLNGGYARASLYADIYGRGTGGQARSKQRIEVNIFNTSTTFDGSNSTIHLDTETISTKSTLDYQIAVNNLKVVHRSGSGTVNNVIEVWLQYRSSSIDNLSAQVFYTTGFTVEKFRIAHQDEIDTGYIAIYDRNGFSYSESLALGTLNGASGLALAIGGQMSISTLPTATTPTTVLVKESGSDIVKSIPYFNYQGATGSQGVTGVRGVTGLIGQTGAQGTTGLLGLTGIQGTTGVGFNYTLSHGAGITGLPYNGTANVTWLEDYKKDYGDGRRKIYTNWTMQGSIANPTGKWVKVLDFTLVAWARILLSGIIRNHTDIFRLAEHRLGLSVYTTDTSNNVELLFENTNSSVADIFDDAKLLRTNSSIPFTFELWLHIINGYGSGYRVAGDFTWGSSNGVTTYNWYEGLITAYDNLPTYNTMYSINITGRYGPQGATGVSGQTGNQGLVGAQGVTGVGFNNTLTPGIGLTGSVYNGTSNVTWSKTNLDTYFTAFNRKICNWGTTSSAVDSSGKWVKVSEMTINGAFSCRSLWANIYGHSGNPQGVVQQRLHLHCFNDSTHFADTQYILLLDTYNTTAAVGMRKSFSDAKIVYRSGSGLINNVIELWLKYGDTYQDRVYVEAWWFYPQTVLENPIPYETEIPTGYINTFGINSAPHNDSLTLGANYHLEGITGLALSVGGMAKITNTPAVSLPTAYLVKDSDNIVKSLPFYSITAGSGLTGMPYDGRSNVTIVKDNADTFFGSLYTKYVNWGASSNGNTDKWMMVASGTINGAWSSFYLYADIYGSQGGYQAMSKQTLQIQVYTASTDIATTQYTLLDTVNTAGLNIDNNIKPFKALKVIRRSGSGVTNNVIEVWLQMGGSFGATFAKVNYNVNVSYLLTNRTAALDAITTGYVSEITSNCSSSHDKLIVTAETATTPAYNLVHESNNSIIKRVPFVPDHIGVERTLVISSGQTQQWVTIATCSTARAYSEFLVYDTESGKHNICKLIASTAFGKNNITVLFGNRYGTITILNARILYNVADRTYGGAKLQVYIDATCTLRVRQLYNATINGWTAWDDTTPVIDTWYPSWAQDNDTLRTDITSSLYSIHGNVEGSVKAGSYIQLDTLTNNRVVVSDASNRLNSSTVTSTELSYLSGKNSVIDGSGNASYIPVFSASNRLSNSSMIVDDYSVCLNNAPSNWGSSFAAYQVGNMSLWANYNFVNGYGTYLSNNRYHDGTGNKAVVSGSSSTYEQTGSTHKFYINNSLTAGVVFTPTEIVNISSYNIRFNIAGGDGLDFSASNGYMNKISATNGSNSQLVLQSKQATVTLHGDLPLILFSVDCYFYGGITTVNSITSGVDLIATRYVVSNTVRTPDANGMLTLAGENASSATIFFNGLLAHQPDTITSGTQTINPNTSYVRIVYNNTSQTYTLGTVAYMTNTRVIVANLSNVSHTIVYGGTSSTLNAGQFREFIRDTYNNNATWIAEW